MIVPDDLTLFLAVVLADHTFPAKRNPLSGCEFCKCSQPLVGYEAM